MADTVAGVLLTKQAPNAAGTLGASRRLPLTVALVVPCTLGAVTGLPIGSVTVAVNWIVALTSMETDHFLTHRMPQVQFRTTVTSR